MTTLHCTTLIKLHYTTQHYTTATLHYMTLHYTNYFTLRYNNSYNYKHIALHCARLITLQYATLIALHYTDCTTTAATATTTAATTTATIAATTATLQYTTLHYTNYTTSQLQLQLHYTNSTALQLQLHYATTTTTTTTALHHTTSSSCGWGDHCNHCNHSKKHNSNYLSVHQSICPAIHASQQLTSPIASYLWNFRHRLVRYYRYVLAFFGIYWTSASGIRLLITVMHSISWTCLSIEPAANKQAEFLVQTPTQSRARLSWMIEH